MVSSVSQQLSHGWAFSIDVSRVCANLKFIEITMLSRVSGGCQINTNTKVKSYFWVPKLVLICTDIGSSISYCITDPDWIGTLNKEGLGL